MQKGNYFQYNLFKCYSAYLIFLHLRLALSIKKVTYNSANHKSRNRKNSISHQQPHYKTHISTSPFHHFSACANNKTPVPDGHFILTADRQEQHLLFCCHPCPVLRIPDLLFHDDAGLELYLYPVRRNYFDAGNQPSDKVGIKFRYLAAVSAQESIHVLHPLFIVFSQLFLFPCLVNAELKL